MEMKGFVEKCRDEGHFTEVFNSGNHVEFVSSGGAKDTNVAISLSHDYDRKPCNEQFESEIEKTWALRREKKSIPFQRIEISSFWRRPRGWKTSDFAFRTNVL